MGKHFLQTSSETNYSKSGSHLETFWQSWLLNIRSADYQVKMSDIDTVIAKVVEDIWGTYDKDNSGALCKDETKKFVIDTLNEMSDGGNNDEFNEEDLINVLKNSIKMAVEQLREVKWPYSSKKLQVSDCLHLSLLLYITQLYHFQLLRL